MVATTTNPRPTTNPSNGNSSTGNPAVGASGTNGSMPNGFRPDPTVVTQSSPSNPTTGGMFQPEGWEGAELIKPKDLSNPAPANKLDLGKILGCEGALIKTPDGYWCLSLKHVDRTGWRSKGDDGHVAFRIAGSNDWDREAIKQYWNNNLKDKLSGESNLFRTERGRSVLNIDSLTQKSEAVGVLFRQGFNLSFAADLTIPKHTKLTFLDAEKSNWLNVRGEEVDISHANLRGSTFQKCHLWNSYFKSSDIRGVEFSNSDLYRNNFERATVGHFGERPTCFKENTNLRGVVLTGITGTLNGLTVEILNNLVTEKITQERAQYHLKGFTYDNCALDPKVDTALAKISRVILPSQLKKNIRNTSLIDTLVSCHSFDVSYPPELSDRLANHRILRSKNVSNREGTSRMLSPETPAGIKWVLDKFKLVYKDLSIPDKKEFKEIRDDTYQVAIIAKAPFGDGKKGMQIITQKNKKKSRLIVCFSDGKADDAYEDVDNNDVLDQVRKFLLGQPLSVKHSPDENPPSEPAVERTVGDTDDSEEIESVSEAA